MASRMARSEPKEKQTKQRPSAVNARFRAKKYGKNKARKEETKWEK